MTEEQVVPIIRSYKTNKVQFWGDGQPWHRQDEKLLEEICDFVRHDGVFHELATDKLYLVNLLEGRDADEFVNKAKAQENCPFILCTSSIDPILLSYEPFSMDFGPMNLSMTHTFCSQVKIWIDSLPYREHKAVLIVLDESDQKKRLNFTVLAGIAAMVICGASDEEVIDSLDGYIFYRGEEEKPVRPEFNNFCRSYTDVSGLASALCLQFKDCIKGFYSAMRHNFYNYHTFDQVEYLCYESVVSGDFNWVVPGKLLAFAGPADKNTRRRPQFYHDYFKENNVTTIVRLCAQEYDKTSFTDKGFEHYEIIFPDGHPPKFYQAKEFIDIVDKAKGAVAVHCYAGIGRTGTLIAAYMLTRYRFNAKTAIAWTRICRPGSVVSVQQDWLLRFERYSEKNLKKNRAECKDDVITMRAGSPSWPTKPPSVPKDETSYDIAEKSLGQARALMMAKRQRSDNASNSCTRHSSRLNKTSSKVAQNTETTSRTRSNAPETTTDAEAQIQIGRRKGGAGRKDANPNVVIDLGKTVPWIVALGDFKNLKAGENPAYYTVPDEDYCWKVKFPPPGCLPLKQNQDYLEDFMAANENVPDEEIDNIWAVFKLDFTLPSGEQPKLGDNLERGNLISAREARYRIVY